MGKHRRSADDAPPERYRGSPADTGGGAGGRRRADDGDGRGRDGSTEARDARTARRRAAGTSGRTDSDAKRPARATGARTQREKQTPANAAAPNAAKAANSRVRTADDVSATRAQPARVIAAKPEKAPKRTGTKGRGRRSRLFWALIGVGAVSIVVIVGFFVWFLRQVDPPGPEGDAVTIEIPDDISRDELATLLADNDVIASAGAFSIYSRVRGYGALPAGEYTFNENSNMNDVITSLRGGPAIVEFKVTIPEGFTISQIAARVGEEIPTISEDDFLQAVASGTVRSRYMPPDAASMEGFLFPDTYVVGEETTAEGLLTRMVERFDEVGTAVGIANVPGTTPYEVVTVASMIEEEAKIADERPKISRVIYNRLNQGIPLGIDATLLYTKSDDRTLTEAELEADSPYNTRTNQGLTPTPISNPGQAALTAAAHPADGEWLYYVIADADGRHSFSVSYEEFLADKAAAQDKGLL